MLTPLLLISTRQPSRILLSAVRVIPTSVLGVVGVKGIGRLPEGAGAAGVGATGFGAVGIAGVTTGGVGATGVGAIGVGVATVTTGAGAAGLVAGAGTTT